MKYKPGKDEADPLDFLSQHPLPIVGNDDTEKIIETEHAVVLDRIREETHQDGALQKLSQTATGKPIRRMLIFHPAFTL